MADDKYGVISREDARAQGLKRFYSNEPCKNGHVCQRYVSSGMCTQCCDNQRREWRATNPERTRQLHREWRKKNPDKERESHLKSNAKWWASSKDEINKRRRQWRLDNLELARARGRAAHDRARERDPKKVKDQLQRWRDRNPERWKEIRESARRAWLAREPNAMRVHASKRRAKKFANGGTHTPADIADIFRLQKCRCAYCGKKLNKKYHVDHIEPISKGGSNNRQNLQILCEPCNLKKHAHDPLDFARLLGKLL